MLQCQRGLFTAVQVLGALGGIHQPDVDQRHAAFERLTRTIEVGGKPISGIYQRSLHISLEGGVRQGHRLQVQEAHAITHGQLNTPARPGLRLKGEEPHRFQS